MSVTVKEKRAYKAYVKELEKAHGKEDSGAIKDIEKWVYYYRLGLS